MKAPLRARVGRPSRCRRSSASREITQDLNLELGDSLTFDVQGVPVQAYCGQHREVTSSG
ncbi:MAG: hypothetical protein U5K31_12710 [Balneolaceae bacterium]|nr:hypothetical protein [Balneolaceae bacterium]